MLNGDLCKRSAPRGAKSAGVRATTALGLERIERLLVQRAGPMIPGQAKPSSSRLWHIRRRPRITRIRVSLSHPQHSRSEFA